MRRDKNYRMSQETKRILTTMVDKSQKKAMKDLFINVEIEYKNKRERRKIQSEESSEE